MWLCVADPAPEQDHAASVQEPADALQEQPAAQRRPWPHVQQRLQRARAHRAVVAQPQLRAAEDSRVARLRQR